MSSVSTYAFATLTLLIACLTACSTNPPMSEVAQPSDATKPDPEKSHVARIERYSAGDSEYAGFYNNFEFKATILNSNIRNALLERQGSYYQWDSEKRQLELEKSNKEAAAEIVVFMSFFTPERRNDNLTDLNSIWRIYLEAGGRRYQAKIKRTRTLLAELQVLFPYHTRWNTPYYLSFPVPTTAIETQESTLTVTGPLGTRTIKFAPVQ